VAKSGSRIVAKAKVFGTHKYPLFVLHSALSFAMIVESFALGALGGFFLPVPTFLVLLAVGVFRYKQGNLTVDQVKQQIRGLNWQTVVSHAQTIARGEMPRAEPTPEQLFSSSPGVPTMQQNGIFV
jgi:hypothetical protein